MSTNAQPALVVLAGGAARRLGGVTKPALLHAGRSLLAGVLDAAPHEVTRIVVGPTELVDRCGDLPEGVRFVREDPPGTGPAAALVAAVGALSADVTTIVLLAGDLVDLPDDLFDRLSEALVDETAPPVDGAVTVDGEDRVQWLCSAWRTEALRRAVAERLPDGPGWAGAPLRSLLGGLRVAMLQGPTPADVDEPADLHRLGVGEARPARAHSPAPTRGSVPRA